MAELPRGVWGHAYIVMITKFLGGAGRFDGGGWGGGEFLSLKCSR